LQDLTSVVYEVDVQSIMIVSIQRTCIELRPTHTQSQRRSSAVMLHAGFARLLHVGAVTCLVSHQWLEWAYNQTHMGCTSGRRM